MMAASRFASFPDIPTVPHQPSSCFTFLKRLFGKQITAFNARGSLSGLKFLHYVIKCTLNLFMLLHSY